MLALLVGFVVGTLLSAVCLWGGMKITNVDGTFGAMFAIAAISAGLGLIPLIGWILGIVVMFILISALTDAEFWPDAVLMVFVAKLLSIGVGSLLNATLLAG